MSNVDINVDRRTDGLTDGRTENRTPISHPATSRCDKNNKGTENEYFELSVICPINNITVKFFPERGRKNEKDEKKAQPLPLLQVRQEPSC